MKDQETSRPAYLSGIAAGLAAVTASVVGLVIVIAYQSMSAGVVV